MSKRSSKVMPSRSAFDLAVSLETDIQRIADDTEISSAAIPAAVDALVDDNSRRLTEQALRATQNRITNVQAVPVRAPREHRGLLPTMLKIGIPAVVLSGIGIGAYAAYVVDSEAQDASAQAHQIYRHMVGRLPAVASSYGFSVDRDFRSLNDDTNTDNGPYLKNPSTARAQTLYFGADITDNGSKCEVYMEARPIVHGKQNLVGLYNIQPDYYDPNLGQLSSLDQQGNLNTPNNKGLLHYLGNDACKSYSTLVNQDINASNAQYNTN